MRGERLRSLNGAALSGELREADEGATPKEAPAPERSAKAKVGDTAVGESGAAKIGEAAKGSGEKVGLDAASPPGVAGAEGSLPS